MSAQSQALWLAAMYCVAMECGRSVRTVSCEHMLLKSEGVFARKHVMTEAECWEEAARLLSGPRTAQYLAGLSTEASLALLTPEMTKSLDHTIAQLCHHGHTDDYAAILAHATALCDTYLANAWPKIEFVAGVLERNSREHAATDLETIWARHPMHKRLAKNSAPRPRKARMELPA